MKRASFVSALTLLIVALGVAAAHADRPGDSEKLLTFTLLGVKFCAADTADEPGCMIRLPAPDALSSRELADRRRPENVLRVFGYRICLREVEPGARCDFGLPSLLSDRDSEPASDSRARL